MRQRHIKIRPPLLPNRVSPAAHFYPPNRFHCLSRHFIFPSRRRYSVPPAAATHFPSTAPPTGPQKKAKKTATKPPDNETKGAKAPFAKPQKAPAPKKKPEGWTDDKWHQNCLRRKLSTTERKGWREAQQEKKALGARAHQHALAGCIATTNAGPWSTAMPAYVPGVFSTTDPPPLPGA
jgi:hypothetical protein